MINIKHTLILFALTFIASASSSAIEDTPENRLAQAIRYSKTTPPEEMFEDMAEQMAKNLPPADREPFKALMTNHLDIGAVTDAMNETIVRHFTAGELKALADFYGSPIGKSAMKKFGGYMADIMPIVQSEVLKAQAEAIKAQAAENRKIQ